ncbi:interleukin-20 receptor subunit beta isoform X2 [Denticeps clupeoides]|uniref:interleukin-20 receptor subunit beta isoform X2 n=1 Tax=Denticeps clupeoides TaxID=299321 RepID=UPI0010A4C19C|nr:uncharacterized protein LOC114788988 isoform X2 [Denticeps clupeoides]
MFQQWCFFRRLLALLLHMASCGAGRFPAPRNLTMDSQNMNHLLRWTLPAASCRPVYSSVQFQGEWELLYLNGSWEDVHMCQRIVLNMCDVTSDLATDSDYNLRVRLECDGHLSPWEHLREPFNRRKTLLTVVMAVSVRVTSLWVRFSPASPSLTISLTIWEKGDTLNVSGQVIELEQPSYTVQELRGGATYCLKAQAHLANGGGRSTTTPTQCVLIPCFQQTWRFAVLVSTAVVGVVLLASLLVWSAKRWTPVVWYTCFAKESLPITLLREDHIPVELLSLAESQGPVHRALLQLPHIEPTDETSLQTSRVYRAPEFTDQSDLQISRAYRPSESRHQSDLQISRTYRAPEFTDQSDLQISRTYRPSESRHQSDLQTSRVYRAPEFTDQSDFQISRTYRPSESRHQSDLQTSRVYRAPEFTDQSDLQISRTYRPSESTKQSDLQISRTYRPSESRDHSDLQTSRVYRAPEFTDQPDLQISRTYRPSESTKQSDLHISRAYRPSESTKQSDLQISRTYRPSESRDHSDLQTSRVYRAPEFTDQSDLHISRAYRPSESRDQTDLQISTA